MELSELTAYAGEKYRIREQRKWAELPGLSVLCHPQTGEWVAVLMRQWDTDTGTEMERCDLKCGRDCLSGLSRSYLSLPVRMHGYKWVGIAFRDETEPDVVFRLFDRAVENEKPYGYTVVLPSQQPGGEEAYRETALPFAGSGYRPQREKIPERLREMRHLYEYGRESPEARAKNFYRQAAFMRDYEDDVPWTGEFLCYYPTYHDLSTQQLRGYFTWRTRIRKGIFEPVPASAAYLYLYELLNGVGADSPEDALNRLRAFQTGYLDSGLGDKRMRQNLQRWMLEYAVLHSLPPETAREVAEPELIEADEAVAALKDAAARSDDEVFSALCVFGGKRIRESPAVTGNPERGKHLFSEAWRAAASDRSRGRSLLTECFGRHRSRLWYPLSNAVYFEREKPRDGEYVLDSSRSYSCANGIWHVTGYDRMSFDRVRFPGFLHEADAKFRRYLKTGRYLKENPADGWAAPYVDAVIAADRQARIDAEKPKITIDLTGLTQIRRDAEITRDSLLTEEETEEDEIFEEEPCAEREGNAADIPLDSLQMRILRTLLLGEDASAIIRENHLMPTIAADFINEALFDEIGDAVLLCDGDRLSVAEEYVEELEQLLGGNANG